MRAIMTTVACLLAGASATSACAREPVAVVVAVQCARDGAAATPCQMTDRVDATGSHDVTFAFGTTRTRFVGKAQGGWWSGTLDGRPVMGYERNRGHVVFSTADLKTTFAWWSKGSEHGAY